MWEPGVNGHFLFPFSAPSFRPLQGQGRTWPLHCLCGPSVRYLMLLFLPSASSCCWSPPPQFRWTPDHIITLWKVTMCPGYRGIRSVWLIRRLLEYHKHNNCINTSYTLRREWFGNALVQLPTKRETSFVQFPQPEFINAAHTTNIHIMLVAKVNFHRFYYIDDVFGCIFHPFILN